METETTSETTARKGTREYDLNFKAPNGQMFMAPVNVPAMLAGYTGEGSDVKPSALRGIARNGKGSHKGWVIVDNDGNPIAPERGRPASAEQSDGADAPAAPKTARKKRTKKNTDEADNELLSAAVEDVPVPVDTEEAWDDETDTEDWDS